MFNGEGRNLAVELSASLSPPLVQLVEPRCRRSVSSEDREILIRPLPRFPAITNSPQCPYSRSGPPLPSQEVSYGKRTSFLHIDRKTNQPSFQQENSLATVPATKTASARATSSGRCDHQDGRPGLGACRTEHQGCREVEEGNANGGADEGQG